MKNLVDLIVGLILGVVFTFSAITYSNLNAVEFAYYCDPSVMSQRKEFVLDCLDKTPIDINLASALSCAEVAKETFGMPGFKRGQRVYPCIEAKTAGEKKACEVME